MKQSHLLFLVLASLLSPQQSDGESFFLGRPTPASLLHISDSNHHQHSISETPLSRFQSQLDERRKRRQRRMREGKEKNIFSLIKSILTSDDTHFESQDSRPSTIYKHIKVDDNGPLFSQKGDASQPSQGMTRKRPNWLKLPIISRDVIERLAAVTKYAALGLIGIELYFIIRDVFEEIFNDFQDVRDDEDAVFWGSGDGGIGSNGKVLSRNSVRKIVAWLEEPEDKRASRPLPNISPAWIIPLAQEIHKCTELSLTEVQRILLQLTKAEASLLGSCLLLSNNKVDFDEIGGLFAAKAAAAQLLLSSLSASTVTSPLSSVNNSSPYEKLIAKGNDRNDLVLWGPPGCGKSIMIRAIAAHSGLPTLVITPSLMIQRKRLKNLFSLISTLGSCVVVLDDLDGLFMAHGDGENDATRDTKTEWLQWWDGLASSSSSSTSSASKKCVLTVAATSRPWDVDTTAWRRLRHRIYIGLPNTEDRYDMLKKWTNGLPPVEESVLQYFVNATEGYIPSDLYQVLTHACIKGPMERQDANLTVEDIRVALPTVLPTRFHAQYIHQLQSYISQHTPGSVSSVSSTTQQQSSSASGGQDYFSPHAIQTLSSCENGYCWQTSLGNFYQFQIPVDSQVLDAIQTILLRSFEWGSSDGEWESLSDDDDFDETDDD